MPLLTSTFRPAPLLSSPHAQTIIPSKLRPRPHVPVVHESLATDDGDFIELEWVQTGHPRLAIVSHGLEGSSRSTYARGMARILNESGFDVLLWNMRGCGSERNRLMTWYHSGKSDDLARVVRHAQSRYTTPLTLVGISVGGNITLKFLGEQSPTGIARAVAVSVPCDLRGSAETLARRENRIYMQYLLHPLRQRMREKATRFPEEFDLRGLDDITTFREFDERYTAPMHGFTSVDEYWDLSSSRRYLSGITVPTLLISALDDPFLSPECFPFDMARDSSYLYLETPAHGGHVGFIDSYRMQTTWLERRVREFVMTSGQTPDQHHAQK